MQAVRGRQGREPEQFQGQDHQDRAAHPPPRGRHQARGDQLEPHRQDRHRDQCLAQHYPLSRMFYRYR